MSTDGSLPASTATLVVGAGVVGCSTAYHLTKEGQSDVTVVDMGDIEAPGGSTVHAPGGLVETSPSKIMTEFASYSRQLYLALDAYWDEGLIEVMKTEERMNQARRLHDFGKSYGVPGGEMLSPEEVTERIPFIDPDVIEGGFLSPTSGLIRSLDLLEAMREEATAGGATFHGNTKVTDIETENGSVTAVKTDRGRVEADQVLIATNIWAPLFGRMVGVDIPLMPCEHQYAVTESLPELEGTDEEVQYMGSREQDSALYFRQHGEGIGVGSYNHEPLLLDPEDIADYEDAPEDVPMYDYFVGKEDREPIKMTANREFTPEHFDAPWADAVALMPALEGADLDKAFNGVFSFTPDGMPIMGEPEGVDGFWVAAAVWLTHAGGVGKTMAEWMTDGYPRQNLIGCDINRFQDHSGSPRFVHDRAAYSYDTVYDLIHPRQMPDVNQNLKTGPFYDRQQDLGGQFYAAAGRERARWYDHNESLPEEYDVADRSGWEARYWSPIEGAEHRAVRDRVGMFDLSGFTNIDVTGPDAEACLQRLCTNDVDVPVGSVVYTLLCNEKGGILGDATVVREGVDSYEVIANSGAAGTEQLAWIRGHTDDFDLTVVDRSSGECAVGVWGPDAPALLEPLAATDLDDVPFFSARETYVDEVPVRAQRVSYVGECGWELHTSSDYGRKLWDLLWEAGQEYGVVPFGDGALNTMRLEKGYPLFGLDITPEYDPYEAGLGFTVDLDTEFVGRDAVAAAAEDVTRRRTHLTLDDRGAVVFNGVPIFDGEETVGYAASADYGHSIDAGIVNGYLPTDYTDPGTSLTVQYEGEHYPATVRETPLFDPEDERMR